MRKKKGGSTSAGKQGASVETPIAEEAGASRADREESADREAPVTDTAAEEEKTGTAGAPPGPAAGDPETQLAELREKHLRLLAEYDNYRKRTAREIQEIIARGSEKLVIDLLPILDNLDRATEHRKDNETLEEYVKGITLIEDQLRAVLIGAGLEPIEVIGKPFDPNIHDALIQMESDKYGSGIVSAEAEKGYMLSGKVIRHSKVIVSK